MSQLMSVHLGHIDISYEYFDLIISAQLIESFLPASSAGYFTT
jgi:hypothetical protein